MITATTDRALYRASDKISVVLANNADYSPYLLHCNFRIGFYIEHMKDSEWTDAGNIAITCLALYPSGSLRLEPGNSVIDTFEISRPGLYRLKYPYGRIAGWTELEYIYSNSFTVE